MNNGRILFLLSFFLLILISFSNAQATGCCCFDYQPYYQWNIDETTCINGGGSFAPNIAGADECEEHCYGQAGFATCEYDTCENSNTDPCFCGDTLTTSQYTYCCAANLGTKVFGDQTSCMDNTACSPSNTNLVSGVVTDGSGNPIENALVSVDNTYSDLTSTNGYYEFSAPAAEFVTVIAQATGCGGESQTVPFMQNAPDTDFTLSCGSGIACQDYNGECCQPGYECQDQGSFSIGQADCNNGYSCYSDCNSGCVPVSGPGGCTVGECSTPNNEYCNEDGWQAYDVTDPAQWEEYCGLCPFDAECINIPCQPSGCDGICPANCDYTEDPDCPSSSWSYTCNINNNPPEWCDSYGETGNIGWTSNEYCEHCAVQDCVVCPATCGNGILECQEECDDGNIVSGDGCSDICEIESTPPVSCQPNNNIDPGEDCDPEMVFPNGECDETLHQECSQACECIPICSGNFEPPQDAQATDVWKERSLQITWEAPGGGCNENLENYTILRCTGSESICGSSSFIDIFTTESLSYTDTGLQNNTNYCYKIKANYDTGVEEITEMFCQNTGDALCLQDHPDTFCYQNAITSCKDDESNWPEYNKLLAEESCEDACVEPLNGEAYCIARGPCEECSSIYYSFADFVNESSDNDFKVNHEIGGTTDSFFCSFMVEQRICHMDTNEKTIDMFEQCADVNSCYDYRSSENCQPENDGGNPCGQFLLDGEFQCEWTEYKPSEQETDFDLGVCVPNQPEKQECGLCNTSNPIFPVCNVELCSMFGDCYYKSVGLSGQEIIYDCVNVADLSCKDYNNKEDCVGSNPTNFSLNLTYGVISNSSDKFGFLKCKWDDSANNDEGMCYRDADDSTENFPNNPSDRDCQPDDQKCLKDFISPNTTIIPEENEIFGKEFSLPIVVEDNTYKIGDPEPGIWVYHCFDYNDTDCSNASSYEKKPIENPEDLVIERNFEEESENENDPYKLYLYAKDFAQNVEEVQIYEFLLDSKTPRIINFSYYYNSYQNQDGEWMSDIEANFSFNEYVTCDINFENLQGQQTGDAIIEKRSMEFSWSDPEVPDGNYYFEIDCTDDNGNSNQTSIPINVEGDKSISEPTPQGLVLLEDNLTLSIKTENQAVCRYSTETPWFAEMGEQQNPAAHIFEGEFQTENNLTHNITIDFLNSGFYRFYTACNISYQKQTGPEWEVTENNAADWIYFSIDQIPPITIVSDAQGNQIDFNQYHQQLDVKFECNDPEWYIDENNNLWTLSMGSFDGRFGCAGIYLCYEAGCEPNSQGATSQTYSLPFAEDIAEEYIFKYRSKDLADGQNNFEEIQEQLIKIDSEIPSMTIEVLRNDEPYHEPLTYGTYEIKINSSKPIENIIRFTYKAEYDDGTSSQSWTLLPATIINDKTFSSSLLIDSGNYYETSGEVIITVEIEDEHQIEDEEDFSIEFNTEGGPAPVPKPIFYPEELTNLENNPGTGFLSDTEEWYPFKHYSTITLANGETYDDLTIIGQENIFITGYTLINGEILFYRIKDGMGGFEPMYRMQQTGATTELDQKRVKTFSEQGSEYIKINTSVDLPAWHSGYLAFNEVSENKGRTAYEEYGRYYQITNAEYLGIGEGLKVNIDPLLEKDIEAGVDLYLIDDSQSNKWFGQEIEFEYSPATPNLYELVFGINDSLNIGTSEPFSVYTDTQPLEATGVQPIGGTINNENMAVEILFQEHTAGTGLKESTIQLLITETNQEGTTTYVISNDEIDITDLGVVEGYHLYMISYAPSEGWKNGVYEVQINVEDYAGNNINMDGFVENNTIEFVYDDRTPTNPLFTVVGSSPDNIDYHYRTVIDDLSQGFILDFSMKYPGVPEELQITIPEVDVLSPQGQTVTCTETDFNIFQCGFENSLSDGLYELQVRASKILPNGSVGPEGAYLQDSEGKQLKIILDRIAPDFTLSPEMIYITENQSLAIYLENLNENFDLWTEIVVEAEEMELEVHQMEGEYYFIVPEEFDWGEEGNKDVQATVHDFAGHQTTKNTEIILDNFPPVVEITNIIAEAGFFYPNTNATVGVREITITGTVDDDTYSLCYEQAGGGSSCIIACIEGQTEQCIQETAGRNTFTLELLVYGEDTTETLNTIMLTATDFSGQVMTESLYVLLDLQAPGEPEIIFS